MTSESELPALLELAARIERTAESLAMVLDPARCEPLASVSPVQLRALMLLHARPGLNVNGLAAAMGVVASSATRLCDRLEAHGLVIRNTGARDRRELQLRLSAAAAQLLDELSRFRQRELSAVLAAMSPSGRRDLARSLEAFNVAAAVVVAAAEAMPEPTITRTA